MADKTQRITADDGSVIVVLWHDNGDGTFSQGGYVSGGGGGAATIADGADVAQGAVGDAVVVAGAAGTISAKLRAISRDLVANIVLAAGTNAIGKLAANSGVDIGDVTLTAGSATIGATQDAGPSWTQDFKLTTSADASSGVDISNSPTSGQKIVIDDLIISVGSTAMTLTFEEETSGTDQLLIYAPANFFGQITPRGKWKLPVADKKLRLTASVSGNVSVRAQFHSEA